MLCCVIIPLCNNVHDLQCKIPTTDWKKVLHNFIMCNRSVKLYMQNPGDSTCNTCTAPCHMACHAIAQYPVTWPATPLYSTWSQLATPLCSTLSHNLTHWILHSLSGAQCPQEIDYWFLYTTVGLSSETTEAKYEWEELEVGGSQSSVGRPYLHCTPAPLQQKFTPQTGISVAHIMDWSSRDSLSSNQKKFIPQTSAGWALGYWKCNAHKSKW